MGDPLPLKPTMCSRKLIALDFVKRYFAEWGASPSLDEIAAALGVSKQRAAELVRMLSADGQLLHTAGKRRGLRLVEYVEQMSQADALLRLRDLGWIVHNCERSVSRKPGGDRSLTNKALPPLPVLDHDPSTDGDGWGFNDEAGAGEAGAG